MIRMALAISSTYPKNIYKIHGRNSGDLYTEFPNCADKYFIKRFKKAKHEFPNEH